ncbi:MAG: hypothetical protein LBJ02_06065 [Bifidobacteriaceae bacterium]|jgi:hypothetical protein|nr:hypothetical protein [Bifidobacteriaceae bacterium]
MRGLSPGPGEAGLGSGGYPPPDGGAPWGAGPDAFGSAFGGYPPPAEDPWSVAPWQPPRGRPVRTRSALADAGWGLGAQGLVGAVLGLVWLAISPRPPAQWGGGFWYAESAAGFNAVQDMSFAAVTVLPALMVGLMLVWWAGRPHPIRRAACWLGGSFLGAGACWLSGTALGGGLTVPPAELGVAVESAPLALTAWGLLFLWPFAASAVLGLSLAARAAFGRTW